VTRAIAGGTVVVLVSEQLQQTAAAQPSKDPTTNTTTLRREFSQVVAPLERACGRRLGNPARGECLAAFSQYPDGVRQVATDALREADVNAVGLFVWRVKNGWHELEPVDDPADELEAEHWQVRGMIAGSLGTAQVDDGLGVDF
jgi:hypothetical protein